MSSVSDKVVIITGASSGIGEATARQLGQLGARLVLGARRLDRLQAICKDIETAGGQAICQATDVRRRADVKALADLALAHYGQMDVLINNAGLMPVSFLDELKVEEWEQMIDVNIKGVLYGIAAVLPQMRKQHSGHIINIASVAGHRVLPTYSVYSGTKFAVRAISEGLRQESRGEIRSTIISPGLTKTELLDHITDAQAADQMRKIFEVAINADAIARAIVYAIEQPDDVDVNEIVVRPTQQER
ncbi:MAG: SDR family oxidoreductase [Gammaproteobacteria bacterium]